MRMTLARPTYRGADLQSLLDEAAGLVDRTIGVERAAIAEILPGIAPSGLLARHAVARCLYPPSTNHDTDGRANRDVWCDP
jgi:hypothetical protein